MGGHPALDFINTAARRDDDGSLFNERFCSHGDLVQWSEGAGLLPRRTGAAVRRIGARHPAAAGRVLGRAFAVRAALRAVLVARVAGHAPALVDVTALNRVATTALHCRRLAPNGAGWAWVGLERRLDAPLLPMIVAAMELLTSPRMRRVRACAGRDCGFLFLDTSPGPGRRWCDMADCGNLAKARRFRTRHRARP